MRLTRYLPFAHDTTIRRRVVKSKIGSLIREGPDKRPSAYTPIGPLRRQQSGLIGRHCHLHESYPACEVLNIFQTSPLLYLPITLDLFQDQVQALARIAARPPSLNPSGGNWQHLIDGTFLYSLVDCRKVSSYISNQGKLPGSFGSQTVRH